MDVILNQDVSGLGKAGSVVKVKDGFARNYLFPKGLAVPSTPANLKKLELERQRKDRLSEKSRQEAEKLRDRLATISLTIPVLVHEEDKLYASVTALDISRALEEEGIHIEKALILLDEPISALGIYEVPVKLHPEVFAKVKVWIVKK